MCTLYDSTSGTILSAELTEMTDYRFSRHPGPVGSRDPMTNLSMICIFTCMIATQRIIDRVGNPLIGAKISPVMEVDCDGS